MRLTNIKDTFLIAIICMSISAPLPAFSSEEPGRDVLLADKYHYSINSENNFLGIASIELENAFDSYKKGDVAATKHHLKIATESLNKAAQHSTTDKSREHARKLAIEINAFIEKINQAPEKNENRLARFWHQAISIIKRETDQLIHSYVELSTAEKILKPLLDAKMHLFNAEHDLFVSNDQEDAASELNEVLHSLDAASKIAKPDIKANVLALSKDIYALKKKVGTSNEEWRKVNVVHSLDKAISEFNEADNYASPTIRLQIQSLINDTRRLQDMVIKSSIKKDYDASMAKLKVIIHQL